MGQQSEEPGRQQVTRPVDGVLRHLPDARDGLTRVERVVLFVLREAQSEFGDRPVPTATLYGRVVEHVDVSQGEFQAALQRLIGGAR